MPKTRRSTPRLATTTADIFYKELSSALEGGHAKREATLLAAMAGHFGLEQEPDLLQALIAKVPRENALIWLLTTAAPFVKMIEEIGSRHKAPRRRRLRGCTPQRGRG